MRDGGTAKLQLPIEELKGPLPALLYPEEQPSYHIRDSDLHSVGWLVNRKGFDDEAMYIIRVNACLLQQSYCASWPVREIAHY